MSLYLIYDFYLIRNMIKNHDSMMKSGIRKKEIPAIEFAINRFVF